MDVKFNDVLSFSMNLYCFNGKWSEASSVKDASGALMGIVVQSESVRALTEYWNG